MFRAVKLEKKGGSFDAAVVQMPISELSEHDVRVRIEYSSINYKDALAICRGAPIVRQWPMVPGIDGVGIVEASTGPRFRVGDRVLLNGWGVGEAHWGCLAQYATLKAEWLIEPPAGLTSHQCMALGTAGYTAMLCVLALERAGVRSEQGEILVTGAMGGVGSIAISLLAGRGFTVVASTGRVEEVDYLTRLGAAEVIDRAALSAPGKPLARERWAGVIDTVGSHTLVNACASTRYGGSVAACGMAQGLDLPGSVAPFILRGISLHGIDSVMASLAVRERAWRQLAIEIDHERLSLLTETIGLDDVIGRSRQLLDAGGRGRIVVDVSR